MEGDTDSIELQQNMVEIYGDRNPEEGLLYCFYLVSAIDVIYELLCKRSQQAGVVTGISLSIYNYSVIWC